MLPTEVWVFDRTGSIWEGSRWRTVFEAPESLPELLYPVCDGYKKPHPHPERAIGGGVISNGSVIHSLNSAESTVVYELNRDPASRGTREYGEITYFQTAKALSKKELDNLCSKLAKLQGAIPKENARYQLVSEYLKALKSGSKLRP